MTQLEGLQALTDDQLLDKLAVEVMGFTPLGSSKWSGRPLYQYQWQKMQLRSRAFDPLTNWNHTMEVVKKMNTARFRVDLTWWAGDGVRSVQLFRAPETVTQQDAPEGDVQRAICLAALLALTHPSPHGTH